MFVIPADDHETADVNRAAVQDSTLLAEIRLGAAWLRLDTVSRAQLRAALDAVERDLR